MRIKDDNKTDMKRAEIIHCAQKIIKKEGIEKLSIRKISTMLKQTPGIVYHYFDSKEAILSAIIYEGYQDIVQTIQKSSTIKEPRERLATTLSAYMHLMCEKDILFPLLMSSKDVNIRKQIDILTPDALERKSIQFLYQTIEQGVQEHCFICDNILLKTQWVWASTYGVISTLMNEKANDTLKNKMIEEHVASLLKSLER